MGVIRLAWKGRLSLRWVTVVRAGQCLRIGQPFALCRALAMPVPFRPHRKGVLVVQCGHSPIQQALQDAAVLLSASATDQAARINSDNLWAEKRIELDFAHGARHTIHVRVQDDGKYG